MPIQSLFKEHGVIGVPVVDVRARFILSSKFGDELKAESTVTEFGKSSFVIRHQLTKAGALAVEGYTTRVWTGFDPNDPSKMKSRPLPKEVIESLSSSSSVSSSHGEK
jgi:4-hydroxybenzoyl-CoA thioesterase